MFKLRTLLVLIALLQLGTTEANARFIGKGIRSRSPSYSKSTSYNSARFTSSYMIRVAPKLSRSFKPSPRRLELEGTKILLKARFGKHGEKLEANNPIWSKTKTVSDLTKAASDKSENAFNIDNFPAFQDTEAYLMGGPMPEALKKVRFANDREDELKWAAAVGRMEQLLNTTAKIRAEEEEEGDERQASMGKMIFTFIVNAWMCFTCVAMIGCAVVYPLAIYHWIKGDRRRLDHSRQPANKTPGGILYVGNSGRCSRYINAASSPKQSVSPLKSHLDVQHESSELTLAN